MAFQLVPEFPPNTANNSCCCCKVQRRPDDRLIDLGFSMDAPVGDDIGGIPQIREGWAILCETCAKEIAHLLGYTTEDISVQLAAMRHELGSLRNANAKMQKALDAVHDAESLTRV